MTKTYLLSFLNLFFFCAVSGQKATIELQDSFKHISLSGENIDVNLVEYDRYAIVTEGISPDGMYFNLKNGLLDIHVTMEDMDGKESLVILFPKNKPVPKIINLSEWVALSAH